MARAETIEAFSRIDILVNAIGGGAGKVLLDAQDYPAPPGTGSTS